MCQQLGWRPYFEPVTENPYLVDFYQDMASWAFHSQVFFLTHRVRSHRALMDDPFSVVQDRSLYEDAEVFARNLHRQGQPSQLLRVPLRLPLDAVEIAELEPDDLVQPDMFVCPVVAKDWTDIRSLVLAVEVLSPTTERYDRGRKRRYFSRVGVPEYWIVDCDQRVIERWRPGAATPELAGTTLEWRPAGATRAFVLDLIAFFGTVHADA